MTATARTTSPTRRSRPVRAPALALAGAAVVLGAALSACGAAAADDDEPEHRAFDLSGASLTVDSDDSALEIVASDAQPEGEIAVTRWFQGTVAVGSDPKVTWSMDGDRLVLREHCSGVVADCSAKHRIVVPRGVAVTVESDDGSVRAGGFRDALSVRTKDGSVRVTDTSGPLELRSGDGSVRAEVSSRTVRAQAATARCASSSPPCRTGWSPAAATARRPSTCRAAPTGWTPPPATAPRTCPSRATTPAPMW